MSGSAAPRATQREWIGLAVLALPTLLLSLDVSVLYLALPHLALDLGADSTQQLWILDIYSFMLAGFLVTMGTLGDRVGRRRLLLIGAASFGAASVLAAFSPTPEVLIASRALLGVAGATLMPSTMALIRTMFRDPAQLQSAIGVWFACFMGGLALGPVVGGLLLQYFWWGSAFLLGVPFMALLLALGPALLPEARDATAGRLDLQSVGLSLATILPLIYGLKELARSGAGPVPIASIAIGFAVGILFVRRQRRLTHPLLDFGLFANHSFAAALSVLFLSGVVMAGITLMATQYLQVVAGLSPLTAGLWLVPQNIAMIGGSLLAPLLARRFGAAAVMVGGLLVGALGLALHTQVPGSNGLAVVVAGLILASGGIALPLPLLANLVITSVPDRQTGSAASVQETGAEFGIALGIATLGTLGTVVYRATLGGSLPDGLPAAALATAREGITGATIAASQLPGDLAAGLLRAAGDAFALGFNAVGGFGAVVFVGLAAITGLAFGGLRRARVASSGVSPSG